MHPLQFTDLIIHILQLVTHCCWVMYACMHAYNVNVKQKLHLLIISIFHNMYLSIVIRKLKNMIWPSSKTYDKLNVMITSGIFCYHKISLQFIQSLRGMKRAERERERETWPLQFVFLQIKVLQAVTYCLLFYLWYYSALCPHTTPESQFLFVVICHWSSCREASSQNEQCALAHELACGRLKMSLSQIQHLLSRCSETLKHKELHHGIQTLRCQDISTEKETQLKGWNKNGENRTHNAYYICMHITHNKHVNFKLEI